MVDIFIWVGRAVCVALIAAAAIALPLTDSATGLKLCDTTERVGRTQLLAHPHSGHQWLPAACGGGKKLRSKNYRDARR